MVAVLVGARALSRKPARPADAGSADAAAQTPHVEPIGPGSGATLGSGAVSAPITSGGSGAAPAPVRGTGAPPTGPGGVPLDLPPNLPPRAPPSKSVAVAPSVAPSADLATFAADMQKAFRQRDTRACKQLVAGLTGDIHQSTRFVVETLVAYCDMMSGDCAGGTARLDRAQVAQGLSPQGATLADQFCPIEGPLETRVARLRAQIGAFATGAAIAPAWCEALLAPAKKAAAEVTSGPHRGILGWGLQALARCVGGIGRCDDARALWSTASTLDESIKLQKPDLGAKCAAASAQLAATEAYADPTALQQALDAAIRAHDVRACQKLLATPIPNLHPGARYGIEMQLGHCEMMSGNCAAGSARLQRIGPSPSGAAIDPSIHAAWAKSHESTYCPITGDVDARVTRLWAQVDGFTSRGGGGNLAWCDTLIGPARTLVGEVATAKQRKYAAMALQRLAACVAAAGRCDQGHELWTLSLQADPGAPGTPDLGAKCP